MISATLFLMYSEVYRNDACFPMIFVVNLLSAEFGLNTKSMINNYKMIGSDKVGICSKRIFMQSFYTVKFDKFEIAGCLP